MIGKLKASNSESVMKLFSCNVFRGIRIDFYYCLPKIQNCLTSGMSDTIASWEGAATRMSSVLVNSDLSWKLKEKESSCCYWQLPSQLLALIFIPSSAPQEQFPLCEHKDPGGWLESIFNRCLWMSAMTVWRVCTATACTLTSTRGSVQFQMKLWIRICSASLLTGISIVMKKQWKHPGTWLSTT